MFFDHMDFRCWLLRILFLIAFPITYLSMQLNPVKRTNRLLNVEFTQVTSPLECIKCYCLSDLHADTEKNQLWVREKCIRKQEDKNSYTIFLLPGDVGSELDRLESVFRHLTANYDAVVYVPGNHEAWRRGIAAGGSATRPEERAENANRMAENSVVKLQEVLDCAKACGVYVGPLRVQLDRGSPTVDTTTTKPVTSSSSSSSSSTTGKGSDTPTINPSSSSPCGAVIFPLYSWYHSGWDKEPELVHPDFLAVEAVMPFARKWGDFAMCSWPEDVISQSDFSSTLVDNTVLAQAFAEINEPFLYPEESFSTTSPSSSSISTSSSSSSSIGGSNTRSISSSSGNPGNKKDSSSSSDPLDHDSPLVHPSDTVISFSHFLPRQELCPEKRFLLEPLLTKVVGSDFLERQVRRLRPHVHLFGHTHIPIDLTLEGIRYIQWPLGYSREADKQCAPIHRTGPLLVFDSTLGQGVQGIPPNSPSLDSIWTAHYRFNARDAFNVLDLAPWVLRRLDAFGGFVRSHQKRVDNEKQVIQQTAAIAGGGNQASTEGGLLLPELTEEELITEEDAVTEVESPVTRLIRESRVTQQGSEG